MEKYQKKLSRLDVFSIALGAIIGWGCFVLPGNSFLPKAGPLGTVIGLLAGAAMVMIISESYGFLIVEYPVSGGEFEYVMNEFGENHAFVCGWSIVLAYVSLIPLNATALAIISKYIFKGFTGFGKLYEVAGWEVYLSEVLVAIFFIVIIGLINIKGVKNSVIIQTAVTIGLFGIILLITAWVLISGADFHNLMPLFQSEDKKEALKGIFAVMAMAPWAYVGFDCIPQMAEEYSFSLKKSRHLIIMSILAAAFCYISVNTITAIAMPWQELLSTKPFWATGTAIEMSIGKIGVYLIGISMFCAVVGGMNAFFLSASRLICAMAERKMLPDFLAKVNKKHKTPANAIIVTGAVSIIAPWFGREVLSWIVDMTSVGTSIAFMYTTFSAYKVAKRTGNRRQKIMGMIGFIFSFFFLCLLLIPGMPGSLSKESRIALMIWVLLACVLEVITKRKKAKL